ncbi:MAG TPA: DUF58 domain-containing protein [Pseudomonadales bacterium]|nr:DUF58 domain-containing protein [Pseudomonadales bacterium]
MQGSATRVRGGAYTDLRELIRLRYAAREINQAATRKSRNPLSGLLTSNFRGRGIDFAEVRVYQPGDDIRSIDWRVTARTEIPHTKLFQEEKERPVLLLVDQSHGMFFGSHHAFKSVVAAEVAALLAWTALDRGDRTGGIVFSERGHREIRPRRNKHAVLRLLSAIDDFNHELTREQPERNGNYLVQALRNVRRVAKHGSTIFLISDFARFDDGALVHFSQMARHNDVVGIHVSDTLERELPRPDLYTITNGQARVRINAASRNYRTRYHEEFAARLEKVKYELGKVRAPLIEIMTGDSVVESLASKYNEYVALQRPRRR